MDDINGIIGGRIRELRMKAGLSQEKLGELADLHYSYIGQIERGEKNASLKSVVVIARALGVTLSTLLEPIDKLPEPTEAVVQQFQTMAKEHPLDDVELCVKLSKEILTHYKKKDKK